MRRNTMKAYEASLTAHDSLLRTLRSSAGKKRLVPATQRSIESLIGAIRNVLGAIRNLQMSASVQAHLGEDQLF